MAHSKPTSFVYELHRSIAKKEEADHKGATVKGKGACYFLCFHLMGHRSDDAIATFLVRAQRLVIHTATLRHPTIRAKIITYSILKTIDPVRFCVSDGQIIPGSNFAGNGNFFLPI